MPPELWMLGAALAIPFAAFFIIDALMADDLEEAAERTSRRFWSILFGAGTISVAAAAEMLNALAEVPALIVGALGIASLIAGISWELFGAASVVTYVVAAAIRNSRR